MQYYVHNCLYFNQNQLNVSWIYLNYVDININTALAIRLEYGNREHQHTYRRWRDGRSECMERSRKKSKTLMTRWEVTSLSMGCFVGAPRRHWGKGCGVLDVVYCPRWHNITWWPVSACHNNRKGYFRFLLSKSDFVSASPRKDKKHQLRCDLIGFGRMVHVPPLTFT